MPSRSCVLAIALALAISSVRSYELCNIVKTQYEVLARTGDTFGSPVAYGQLVDQNNAPIIKDGKNLIANNPDFSSILKVGNELYVMSQTESPSPSGMFLMRVEQNSATGSLTVVPGSVKAIDFSSVGGLWIPCGGIATPWQSHLGAEEYEPDAKALAKAQCVLKSQCGDNSWEALDGSFSRVRDHLMFYGLNLDNSTTLEQLKAVYQPYMYGHAVEVAPKVGGSYTVTKWMTFGRIAREVPYLMPDQRTVYSTDDGDRVGFFKFVADRAADFSSGTIYAAKMTQKSAANGGNFDIDWIEMASGSQSELEDLVNGGLSFSSIFETAEPSEDGTCPSGFKSVNVGGAGLQCLKLKNGMEMAAAFFESRRYAAYLGGTTEFTKWEGITYSKRLNKVYTAMSEIRRPMEDNKSKGKDDNQYDIGGPNDVRVEYNPCGCVYTLDVDGNYNIYNMKALVCGRPTDGDPKNTCDIDGIANPDNLAIMEEQDQLLILEDTGSGHQNDVVWAYNLRDDSMVRIFSSPYGSETTSGWWYNNVNGWAYLLTIVQHPYGESDEDQANRTINPFFDGVSGYLGYWAFPADQVSNADITFKSISYPTSQRQKSETRGTNRIAACVTCDSYSGTYRFESMSCPGKYLSVSTSCDDTKARLDTAAQAGSDSESRRDWAISANPYKYTNIVSEGRAGCSKNILASNTVPTFGSGASLWQYKIMPTDTCSVVNLKAKSGDGKDKFLGVKSDCSGFYWRSGGSGDNAKWKMMEQ